MITIEGLRREYTLGGQVIRAVDGMDLEIHEGESVALLGPSGSGKSTLMHLLGALDTPDAGRIAVGELQLAGLDADAAARYRGRNVGFVFQSFHLHPHLTALENVALPLKLAGVPTAERQAKAKGLLELVGLGERLDHRPSELSGGQQQRVSIARALVNDPRVLLADEPTGNLDTKTGAEVMELFDTLHAERGLTLITVTHDPEVAARMGRVVRIRDGRIEAIEGEPSPVEAPPREAGTTAAASPLSRASAAIAEVFASFKRHPLRTGLTGFGITVGGLAITLMVGLGIGLQNFISTQAESVNDPLSLWVTNSSYGVSDIVGNRAQQLGRIPAPLKEKSLERLSKARQGFDAFSDEQVQEIAGIPGVESVRPRTFVVMDGVRLLEPDEAPSAATQAVEGLGRVGEPTDFPEVFYFGYTLVRSPNTPLRIEAGRGFQDGEEGIVLSYQYAEAWGLTPAQLVGREVEVIFPELSGYAEFNTSRPQDVDARYLGLRVKVQGVTTKSILSSAVFLPPTLGEKVSDFQFGGQDPEAAGALSLLPRLRELQELARDDELVASLDKGSAKAQALGRMLASFGSLSGRSGGEGGAPNVMVLMGAMSQARKIATDEGLGAELEAGDVRQRRLLRCLKAVFGQGEGSPAEPASEWGSRVRVRVESEAKLAEVTAALQEKGYRVRSLQDNLAALSTVFAVINTLLSSFGVIALFVAALGIANTLIMAVYERTAEIGVMKAVGATNGQIRRLFALEALILGLMGGGAGAVIGLGAGELFNAYGISWLAADWEGFRFFAAPWLLVGATVLFCGLISFLAGLYPAHRAATLDPIVALRSD